MKAIVIAIALATLTGSHPRSLSVVPVQLVPYTVPADTAPAPSQDKAPTPDDKRTAVLNALSNAVALHQKGDDDTATHIVLNVLENMDGVDDETQAKAFLIFAGLAIANNQVDAAELAFNHVLILKDAPQKSKDIASQALAVIKKARNDMFNREHPETII